VLLEIVGFPPIKLQEFADIKVAKQRDAKIRELALKNSRIFETKWILEQLVRMVQLEPKNRSSFSVIAKNIVSNVGLLKSWANLSCICRKGLDLKTNYVKMKSMDQGGLIAKVNCCHLLYKYTLGIEMWAAEMFASKRQFHWKDNDEEDEQVVLDNSEKSWMNEINLRYNRLQVIQPYQILSSYGLHNIGRIFKRQKNFQKGN